jgi:regulator of sigma E protease
MLGILMTFSVIVCAIFFHELGHFIAMKRNGIKVLEFSLGFGPRIFSRQGKDGTVYSLRALPLGGFVVSENSGSASLAEITPWVKFKVAIAGPMMNALLSMVALIILTLIHPDFPLLRHPLIVWLPEDIRPVVMIITFSFGVTIITPPLFFYLVFTKFMTLLSGLAGPIGLFQLGSHLGSSGSGSLFGFFLVTLWFTWFINVGIGGFNLMPLHPLDGGLCLKALIEKIGVRRDSRIFSWFNYITVAAMIVLIIVVCTVDIMRLIGFLPALLS